jgi:hypothetical protein
MATWTVRERYPLPRIYAHQCARSATRISTRTICILHREPMQITEEFLGFVQRILVWRRLACDCRCIRDWRVLVPACLSSKESSEGSEFRCATRPNMCFHCLFTGHRTVMYRLLSHVSGIIAILMGKIFRQKLASQLQVDRKNRTKV